MKIKLTELFARFPALQREAGASPVPCAPEPKATPGTFASYPYHAVAVKPGKASCARAIRLRGIRMLSRSAPSFPLPGCTAPHDCTCRFQKYNDRRHIDRRLFGTEPDPRHFSGMQRRQLFGRRATDPQSCPS
jgi:hypothetical protein